MTQIIKGLREIASSYRALYCDLWGVVHNGERLYEAAAEALMEFRLSGGRVVLLTNSPLIEEGVKAQLQAFGLPDTAYDAIASAGTSMRNALFASKYRRGFFIGRESDKWLLTPPAEARGAAFAEAELEDADCVICAGPDYGVRDAPEDYEIELRMAANRRLPLFCANPDIVVERGEDRIWCAGAIAQAYEEMGGLVYQFGKPHPPIYALAAHKLATLDGRSPATADILVIGDGIETDIKGATQEDMDALFITGGLAAEETRTRRQAGAAPDARLLNDYLAEHGSAPRHSMGMLGW